MANKKTSPAKIVRPAVSGVIPRERLFEMLDQAQDKPVIYVSGPAGCGKTSFVSSYVEARQLSALWFQVDSGDNDLPTFFYYLGLAGKKAAPRRRKTFPLLTPEYLLGIPTFCQNFFSELFDRLKEPALVVFDNYQEVAADAPLHGAILEGLNRQPQGIRIVILSRQAMPTPFSRLQANRVVEKIGWSDLRFTIQEFESAAETWGHGDREALDLEKIHHAADGWIAGLFLMLESSGASPDGAQNLKDENVSEIFNLFASETYSRLAPRIKDFLLKTACLPVITPETALKLTDSPDASRILSFLYKNNYFVERRTRPQVSYQYHPLFRSYLEKEASVQFPAETLKQLQIEAANLLTASNQFEAAVELMDRWKETAGMVSLIMNQAPFLLQQGRHRILRDWLESLPARILTKNPWMQYWLGVSCILFDLEKAHGHFEAAYSLFESSSDQVGLLMCTSGAIDCLLMGFAQSRNIGIWITRLERIVTDPDELPDSDVGARAAASMYAALVWGYPDHSDFTKWEEKALEFTRAPDIDQNIIVNTLFWGLVSNALRQNSPNLEWILDKADEVLRNSHSPLSRIQILFLKDTYSLCSGESRQGLKYAEEALELANQSGVHALDSTLMGTAVYYALTEHDQTAARHFVDAMRPLLEGTGLFQKGNFYYATAMKETVSGNYEKALANVEAARAILLDLGGSFFTLVNNYLFKARLHLSLGDRRKAGAEVSEAKNLMSKYNYSLPLGYCHMLEAAIMFDAGDEGKGFCMLQKALAHYSKSDVSFIGAEDHDFLSPLLTRALEAGIEIDQAQKMIQKTNLVPTSPPLHIENWPWPLRVYTLGRFEVVRDGLPLKSTGKAQQKPLSLLKALISLGGRKVSDSRIADALWPDADGDMQLQSLSTTLHRLRRLLGVPNAITYNEGRLTLDARYCWVDAWALERILGEADRAGRGDSGYKKALELSEKALHLYRGGFLPQHLDDFWAITMRERLKSRLIQAILRTGRRFEKNDQWQDAMGWYERALAVDPLIEECYQRLMSCHRKLGHHAEIMAVYDRCCKIFDVTLGIEPSEETKRYLNYAR